MRTIVLVLGLALVSCSSSSDGTGANGTDGGADTGGNGGGGDDSGSGVSDGGGGGGDDAGNGDDGSTLPVDGGADGAGGTFALTSTALAPGATFGTANTCDGANTSPPFAWTGAPAGAKSFAVVLTDKTINLVHWAIYDIDPAAVGTPAAIEENYRPKDPAGSKQADSVSGKPVYSGPCPPKGKPAHTYEFAVYAVDVASLPGAVAATKKEDIVTALGTHMVGSASLTGQYGR